MKTTKTEPLKIENMQTETIRLSTQEIKKCTEILASKQLCCSLFPINENNKWILKFNYETYQAKRVTEFYNEFLIYRKGNIRKLKKELLNIFSTQKGIDPALNEQLKKLLFKKPE